MVAVDGAHKNDMCEGIFFRILHSVKFEHDGCRQQENVSDCIDLYATHIDKQAW